MSKLNNQPFTIRVRRGTRSNIQKTSTYSVEGELAYTTNTKNLFVSDGSIFQPVLTLDMAVIDLTENVVCYNGQVIYNY